VRDPSCGGVRTGYQEEGKRPEKEAQSLSQRVSHTTGHRHENARQEKQLFTGGDRKNRELEGAELMAKRVPGG
ncbi:MAG: hypothetical protein ACKOJF_31820, partial [Planctomycetaceae bacterium]